MRKTGCCHTLTSGLSFIKITHTHREEQKKKKKRCNHLTGCYDWSNLAPPSLKGKQKKFRHVHWQAAQRHPLTKNDDNVEFGQHRRTIKTGVRACSNTLDTPSHLSRNRERPLRFPMHKFGFLDDGCTNSDEHHQLSNRHLDNDVWLSLNRTTHATRHECHFH